MTTEDYGALNSGRAAKVYVYEHLRENTHDLFGFIRLDTRQFFEQLLGVNGVGPKMALSVLSIGTTNDVRRAIAAGDVKFIQQAAGVGKRVAERIVVELKDKVGLDGVDLASSGLLQGEATMLHDEAAQALISLGYSLQDAVRALQSIDDNLPAEERIKQALKAA
jgi:Holliday junction DNA helicase RuvA